MPTWPDGVTLVTIRHTPVTTGGRIFPGSSVTARASERLWTDNGSILPADAATTVQADGSWEIQLPAVDAGVTPTGAAYRLTEHVPGAMDRSVWVAPRAAQAPGPVDLVDVLSPQPSPGGGIVYPITPEMRDLADQAQGYALAASGSADDAAASLAATQALGLRVDTTVGTRIFVGSGSSEVMLYGDTGWREVDWMPEGHSWTIQRARRIGSRVYLHLEGTISGTGQINRPSVIEPPFRTTGSFGPVIPVMVGTSPRSFICNSSGTTYLSGGSLIDGGSLRATLTWSTDAAWPTTLPGTPA